VQIAGYYDSVRPPTGAERAALADMSNAEEDDLRKTLGLDEFLDGLTGAALWERLAYRPSSNISGLDTGYHGPGIKTVLPAVASGWMDFRLVPDQHPEAILELLRAHLEREGFGDIEVTPLVLAKPATTSLDDPFVRRVVAVAEAGSGKPASIAPLTAGTLPIVASMQDRLELPGLSAPDNPVYWGSKAHAPNEHIRLEDVEPALRFTYELLRELGKD
jgi:acetylornithine deacetylase/succinyl-diaminopimelate desuccinylase-like protein